MKNPNIIPHVKFDLMMQMHCKAQQNSNSKPPVVGGSLNRDLNAAVKISVGFRKTLQPRFCIK